MGLATASFANHFLVLSDLHLNKALHQPMPVNIAPHPGTDLDQITLNRLLTAISYQTQQQKPDFILLLGDLVGHATLGPEQRGPFVAENESAVFEALKKTFQKIPIIYVFGNNDAFKKDYGAFIDKNQSPYTVSTGLKTNAWRDGALSTGNTDKIKIVEEDKSNGNFTLQVQPTLQLIGINTVAMSTHADNDPQAIEHTFTFLKTALNRAKAEHFNVIIAMHVPPGQNVHNNRRFLVTPAVNHQFIGILKQYKAIIIGLLAGHTHMSEVKRVESTRGKYNLPMIITPGLSTSHGNSAAYNQFTYQKINRAWRITNVQTFHFTDDGSAALKIHHNFHQLYGGPIDQPIEQIIDSLNTEKLTSAMTLQYTADDAPGHGVSRLKYPGAVNISNPAQATPRRKPAQP